MDTTQLRLLAAAATEGADAIDSLTGQLARFRAERDAQQQTIADLRHQLEQRPNPDPKPVPDPPANPGPTPKGRTAALWPFASDSVWNLPTANNAELAPAADPRNVAVRNTGANGSGLVWVNQDKFSHPIAQAAASDPLATVTDTLHTSVKGIPAGGSWQERIPGTAQIAAGSDRHCHVLSVDGRTLIEHFGMKKQSDTAYTCTRRHQVSLTGTGIGPQNGTRAYGGSAIGGLIRGWEVDPTHPDYTGTIRHALAVALRQEQLLHANTEPDEGYGDAYGSDGYGLKRGYVWPATEQDWNSTWAYKGQIPMGSYFVIPPTVDIATLGLKTPQGLMLAKAAQDYGVYVTDCSGATAFYAEAGSAPAASFTTALRNSGGQYQCHDPRVVLNALRVVTNNGASTPNGGPLGAARRAPLAPQIG